MRQQTSTAKRTSQQDSILLRKIGARLREERLRIDPTQGQFAERIGMTQGKLSHIEVGRTEAKAGDLARLAAAGVDVCYLLTGERSDHARLSPEASTLVNSFEMLPPAMQRAALATIDAMAGAAPTLHAPRADYRAPISAPARLPSEPAMERMFEALLAASPGMYGAELAHELARRLPIALEAASAPLLDPQPMANGSPRADLEDPADDDRERPRARRT